MGDTHFSGPVTSGNGIGVARTSSIPRQGPTVFHTGDLSVSAAATGTDTAPVITETYFARVFVPVNATLAGISILNGTAVAGNVIVALYSSATGVVLAQSAATAQAGTAAFQQIPFTTPHVTRGPANYYVAVQFSSASARFRSHAIGNFSTAKQTGQTFGTLTTLSPIPSTFTANVGPIADTYGA